MLILLAAPTNECKRYAVDSYIKAVIGLRGDFDVLLVDNSSSRNFSQEMNQVEWDRFHVIHLPDLPQGEQHEELRIGKSREVIRRRILAGGYSYWFSLEVDVVPPPDTLLYLLRMSNEYGFDIVRHAYPSRTDNKYQIDAMGCALYSRKVLENMSWEEGQPGYVGGDCAFWQWTLEQGFKACNLFNVFKLKHLGD